MLEDTQGELVQVEDTQHDPRWHFKPTGLDFHGKLRFAEWDALGELIADIYHASAWYVGDWYNVGAEWFGEVSAVQAKAIGVTVAGRQLAPATVETYAALARSYPPAERVDAVGIAHHMVVMARDDRRALLARAAEEKLTVAQLRRIVNGEPVISAPRQGDLVTELYDVIYADPPWKYSNTGVNGAADKHYETMTEEQIARYIHEIKIGPGADAALFLWTTNPMLREALRVMEAWGFEYKTNIAWVKKTSKIGMGFYVRGEHELLLIGIRGQMPPVAKNIRSVMTEPRAKHSEKPDRAYGVIEAMYPDRRYVELFARRRRVGWDAFGDQVPQS